MEPSKVKSTLTEGQIGVLKEFSLIQCKEAIKLLESTVRLLVNADYQNYMQKEVKDLELSMRSYNVLVTNGIFTIGDIMSFGLENLNLLRGCGDRSHFEIKQAILKDMPANGLSD